MSSAKVHLVLACKSELAFLPMRGSTVVEIAFDRIRKATTVDAVSIWAPADLISFATDSLISRLNSHNFDYQTTLAEHIAGIDAEVVLIHDAQRPLTLPATIDEVAETVSAEVTRVCPAHIVVDTLKVLNPDSVVVDTVNRDKVQTLSSPEGYWKAAISNQVDDVWHFETSSGKTDFVRGTTEATRIRAAEDVLLVESFLVWQTMAKAQPSN